VVSVYRFVKNSGGFMRKLLGVFFCIGMVAVFSGCGDGATSPDASATATVVQPGAVAQSVDTVARSVEIVYFGSPG
jgi:hypothetical protein